MVISSFDPVQTTTTLWWVIALFDGNMFTALLDGKAPGDIHYGGINLVHSTSWGKSATRNDVAVLIKATSARSLYYADLTDW